MTEYDNVRDALKDLIDISQYKCKIVDGKEVPFTGKEIQEMVFERSANIADILGMSELYLEDQEVSKS